MKLLRILTGLHAGAQLRLGPGTHIVGSDAVDVHITDWKLAAIRLTIEEGQPVAVASLAAGAADALEMPALEDLMPRRFKDVVLCVGPADKHWPSDIKLLEKMVRAAARPNKPKRAPLDRKRATLMGAGAVLSVAMLSGFGVLISRGNARASTVQLPLHVKIQRVVHTVGAPGITVRPSEGRVIVEGLVADNATNARLRAALLPFGTDQVLHRFACADDLAQSITDALATPGVAVRYRGDGVFLVDGRAVDLDKLRAEARRIASDLGPMVQRIDFSVAEMPSPERIPMGSMLAAEDLRYVQTRDGTKHLFLASPVVKAPASAVTRLPD